MLAWKQPSIQRVRNSSLVEWQGIDNNRASRTEPKPRNILINIGRGAFQLQRIRRASGGGAPGKANVGISNDNGGAKPPRRKSKVSWATLIVPG